MFDRAKAIAQVNEGVCACEKCKGTLTEAALSPGRWRFCRICRCAWKVSTIDRQVYATAIHAPSHTLEPTAESRQRLTAFTGST